MRDYIGENLLFREDLTQIERQERELTGNVNYLLKLVDINKEGQEVGVNELRRVASSIFVALFEKLFSTRLDGIIRNPTTKSDYVVNAQRVVDGLAAQIQMDLQHITGLSIVNGDLQALSNLVHIFFHIVSITTGGSQSSGEANPNKPRAHADSSDSIGESLSTHESTFADGDDKVPRSSRRGLRKISETLRRGARVDTGEGNDLRHIVAKEAEGILRSSEIMLAQQQRMEAARRRREGALKARELRFGTYNRHKEGVSTRMMHERFREESTREENAFLARRSNEEHVMLRRIYKGLLSKMHEWRADKHEEVKEKVQTMREEAKKHIRALQTLFEDRVKVLRDSEVDARLEDQLIVRTHRKVSAEMRRTWAAKQRATIQKRRQQLSTARSHELLMRREAHKNLLALLSSEKWSDTLRASDTLALTPADSTF